MESQIPLFFGLFMFAKSSRYIQWFLYACIPVYGVFLALPFLTDVGYEYLRGTAEKAEKEMTRLSAEIEAFHAERQCYPYPSASGWITEASRSFDGVVERLFPPGYKSETLFDPFIADGYTQTYRYYSDGETWYAIACNGPDLDVDVDRDVLKKLERPSKEALADLIYNPQNGNRSGGDVIVVGGNGDE